MNNNNCPFRAMRGANGRIRIYHNRTSYIYIAPYNGVLVWSLCMPNDADEFLSHKGNIAIDLREAFESFRNVSFRFDRHFGYAQNVYVELENYLNQTPKKGSGLTVEEVKTYVIKSDGKVLIPGFITKEEAELACKSVIFNENVSKVMQLTKNRFDRQTVIDILKAEESL